MQQVLKDNEARFTGCLLGTAVGDSLGLPYEGLSPRHAAKLFPDATRHHLFFGKGMVSDDAEHACFVAQALIRSQGDVTEFQKQLARSLRWWLLALPAGVGFATLRSIGKLWIGFSPQKSGVFSAGNGPAMRSPILGLAYGRDSQKLIQFVRASTEITHSDPKAYYAALAIALAAYQGAGEETPSAERFLATLKDLLPQEDAQALLIEQKTGKLVETVRGLGKNYAGNSKSVADQIHRSFEFIKKKWVQVNGWDHRLYIDYLLYCPDYRVKRLNAAGLDATRIVDAGRADKFADVIMEFLPEGGAASSADYDRAEGFFTHHFELIPDVSTCVQSQERVFTHLTSGLFRVIDGLQFSPFRLRLPATAGSGKSQLGLRFYQQANTRGERAKRVLLCGMTRATVRLELVAQSEAPG